MRPKTLMSVIALGMAITGTPAAFATPNTCAGIYETNCQYCARGASAEASDPGFCRDYPNDYQWQGCSVYIGVPRDGGPGTCVVGAALAAPGDEAVCPILVVSAPTVDALGQPELIWIDTDGDLYLAGELLQDCPPYAE